jgi:hypothetical protein
MSWSSWVFDETRSTQDHRDWHVYRAILSNGAYLYDQRQYPKQQYPECVGSNTLGLRILKSLTLSSSQQLIQLLNSHPISQLPYSECAPKQIVLD